MLTDRGRRVSICIGTLDYGHRKFRGNGCYGGFVDRSSERCREWSPSSASRILRISSPTTSPPSATSPVSLNCSYSNNGSAGGYIEHRVSKFDTLAGIAIKYGVEVNSFVLLIIMFPEIFDSIGECYYLNKKKFIFRNNSSSNRLLFVS